MKNVGGSDVQRKRADSWSSSGRSVADDLKLACDGDPNFVFELEMPPDDNETSSGSNDDDSDALS